MVENNTQVEEKEVKVEYNTMRVFAKARKNSKGKEFLTYSFTKDGKKFYDVRFRQSIDTHNIPHNVGYWLLTIPKGQANIKKATPDENGKLWNDIIWVKECVKCVEDEEYEKKREQERNQEVDDLLDDLPF